MINQIIKEMSDIKIAYKGTDSEMRCRKTQFEVGKTYFIDEEEKVKEVKADLILLSTDVKLCSKKVIHYCDKLEDVFGHYANRDGNRFFEIEVLGKEVTDGNKSGSRCIKFLREITKEELDKLEEDKKQRKLDEKMHVNLVKGLQELNPFLIIGGSVALYLQGVRLKRFKDGGSDLDITFPFYQRLSVAPGITVDESGEDRPSGSDYGETISINDIKADIRIDPAQKYNTVKYCDFEYKVIPLHTIIKAKAEYAHTKWGLKHRMDLEEMILKRE